MTKGQKQRAEIVYAMDLLARSINKESIAIRWMTVGVADADIDYTKPYDDALEDIVEDGYTDDDTFSYIMGRFLSVMSEAKEDGGLFVDHILSK